MHLLLFSLVCATSIIDIVFASNIGANVEYAQDHNKTTIQDLVKVHESAIPISCMGAKPSDLAPESQVVGVYFDSVTLNINQGNFDNYVNKTKQSQEFDTHKPTVDVNTPSSNNSNLTPTNSELQPSTILPVTELSVSTTTSAPHVDPSPSSLPTTTSSVTPIPDKEPDSESVGIRTTRTGLDVFCGEGNPSGKSNKNLLGNRIVGGQKSEPGEFPFQVRLNIRSRRGSGICGGVILDDRHILTAAHCMTACASQYLITATIESTGVKATIGDHSIRSNDGEVEIDIEKITPHEKYDACNFYANDHDIAVIKTSQPIEYRFTTDGYGSINRPCMPNSSNVTYQDGDQVVVSGWGVTRENSGSLSNILRYVQVPIVNVTKCQDTYGTRVTNDHVCAGFQAGGKDSCQGDSGGPLVRVVENRYELVGIVSFGYGCGQPSAPGVYTRVASYIDWISANL